MSLRVEVFDLDGGRCIGCGTKLRRNGSVWDYQAHHVIRQNVMKARGLRPRWWRGPSLCVLTCKRCHERHTTRTAVIPLERLPQRIHRAVCILGPWAVDLLQREHPHASETSSTLAPNS